jgi:hypothetical protein
MSDSGKYVYDIFLDSIIEFKKSFDKSWITPNWNKYKDKIKKDNTRKLISESIDCLYSWVYEIIDNK